MTESKLDPMDRYSTPYEIEDTLLGKIFHLNPRENPEKPGRSLRVIFDTRFPLVQEFRPEYSYSVTFERAGNVAGNHFHNVKKELFYALAGEFEIHMERMDDKQKETVALSSDRHAVLYIAAGIAHKVISKNDKAVLLVVASAPNIEGDEFPYAVNP